MKYKNIVLVGGSGLIGSSVANYLLSKLRNVYVIDKIRPLNKDTIFFKSIKSDENSIKKTLKKIIKKAKKVDALINCAYPLTRFSYSKESKINRHKISYEFNNHFGFFYNYTKVYLNYFLKKKFGQIINFSSIYGSSVPRFQIYKGTKLHMPLQYGISKTSINYLTKFYAEQYKNSNIRLNIISPGGIYNKQNKKFVRNYSKFTTSKRMLNPEDLNFVLSSLICKETNISGKNFVVDHGFLKSKK